MPTSGTQHEFATIVSAPSGSVAPETRDIHRPSQLPGTSRQSQSRQSDTLLFQTTSGTRPPLQRGQSQIQQALASSAKFVGIPYAECTPDLSEWDSRRLRFLNKRYKLKDSVVNQAKHVQQDMSGSAVHSEAPTVANTPSVVPSANTFLVRSSSIDSSRPRLEKKDSVVKVVYDTVSSFIKRGTVSRPKPRHAPLAARSSFDAADLDDTFPPSVMTAPSPTIQPVIEEQSEVVEEEEEEGPQEPVGESGAECVELKDLGRVTDKLEQPDSKMRFPSALPRRFPGFESLPVLYDDEGNPMVRPRRCFAQIEVHSGILEQDDDEEPASPTQKGKRWALSSNQETTPLRNADIIGVQDSELRSHVPVPYEGIGRLDIGSARIHPPPQKTSLGSQQGTYLRLAEPDRPFSTPSPKMSLSRQMATEEDPNREGMVRVLDILSTGLVPRRQPRYRGVGPIGRLFNHHLGKAEVNKLNPRFQEILENGEDHRPFFTYWVTTVQILVCCIALFNYGFGTWGLFERVEITADVLDTSFAPRRVSYHEPTNIWFGPSLSDLVQLGAKYSPCMRRERGVWEKINSERQKENNTACCIFNDRSGCYQTSENSCPRTLATWEKWPKNNYRNSSKIRYAGSVCGQDPAFCAYPQSVEPREWKDDLTKWPICKVTRNESVLPRHMTCQVTGRPCCIQMQGLCRITTKEYCNFVQGTWHSDATLCSQVDCFGDICGMLPFFSKDHPNQFYRLFTSLFIHAGLLHLVITLFVHRIFMADLEALIGWKRMALVYIGSGIGGNLASAIFVPYNPEVGPSGSQLGIVAALIVDVIHHRKLITNWQHALAEHIMAVIFLLVIGLVPFIDNWAHIFGFIFGLLITMSCFPYLNFSDDPTISKSPDDTTATNRQRSIRRKILVGVSSFLAGTLFVLLCYVYFSNMEINCPLCGYLNCVNIMMTDHYCDNKGLELKQWLPI